MSERGLRLFRKYVESNLNQPGLSALDAEEHAKRLVAEAEQTGIPAREITEEVGAIADAIAVVKINKERDANRT